jgi:hypothetical protein
MLRIFEEGEMKNKDSPLKIFNAWIFGFIFSLTLNLLIPVIADSQVVSPRISFTSSQEPSGIILKIKGTSFSSGSMATLYAKNPDGSQIAIQNMNISKDGTFDISHLLPAGYPPGTYLLWVVDDSTGRYSNRINFDMPATKSTELVVPPPPYSPAYTPQHGDVIRMKGDMKIYLVQSGQRRCFANGNVFRQMGFKLSDVKEIDPQDAMNIPEGPPIWSRETMGSFPDGSLIRLKGQAQTYVIQGGRKCYIPDPETFHSRGYRWDQVIEVDKAILDSLLTGIPIQSVKPPFQYTPPGQQPGVQPPPPPPPAGSPPPYQPQPYPPPLSSWPPQPYGSSSTQSGTGSIPYQTQPQSFFPDGTLIKGSGPDIYLIQNGARCLIPDTETFKSMGFNSNNIINVDDQKLGNLPMGIPVPRRTK